MSITSTHQGTRPTEAPVVYVSPSGWAAHLRPDCRQLRGQRRLTALRAVETYSDGRVRTDLDESRADAQRRRRDGIFPLCQACGTAVAS